MISAIILTKNEEANITSCLESLTWCDEIVVIDDNSTDQTAALASAAGARVVIHRLLDFSDQRNFALRQTKADWILFVDADERVPTTLKNEIVEATKKTDQNGYFLKRIDYMWGKALRYGETGNVQLLRLARKSKGEWVGKVHETWIVDSPVSVLHVPLAHFPHRTISDFLSEINTYSDIRAQELKDQGVKVSVPAIIIYPKAKFLLNYIIKLGFLDGIPGLLSAAMMSLHSFLVRGKLWLLWQRKSNS